MSTADPDFPQHRRILARALLFAAIVIVGFEPTDAFAYPAAARELFFVRVGWGGGYLLLAFWLRSRSPAVLERVRCGVAVLTPLAFGAFLAFSGPLPNGAFPWLIALPLALVLLLRSTLAQAIACSASALAVGVALLWWRGAEPDVAFQWGLSLATSGMLASWAAHSNERLRREAADAVSARVLAQQALNDAERRNAEQERLALIGQLAAGVAHEINSPLGAARSNVAYLKEEASSISPAELEEVLGESQQAIDRIARIVRALHVYARTPGRPLEDVDVGQALARAAALVAVKVGVDPVARIELPGALVAARADESQLVQALVEVLDNAAYATRDLPRGTPRVRVTARRQGDRIVLEIDDDGAGFTAEALARAGTPFFTTKGPGRGVGLGLAGAKETLAHMGAELAVSNRAQGGARVTVSLKAGRAAQANEPATPSPAHRAPNPPMRDPALFVRESSAAASAAHGLPASTSS